MKGGPSTTATCVYPWHDLAWDLALADGMDPTSIECRFAANKAKSIDDDRHWQEATSIQDVINTEISTHLWRDILEGKVTVRKANGNPLRVNPKLFKLRGSDTPHLTVDEGNAWLKKNRYLQVWAPDDSKKPEEAMTVSTAPLKSAPPAINWRHQVQAGAYQYWLTLRASGSNPSVYSICDRMAQWCRDNNIKGDKGQDPKAGTIRNTVLNAKSWTPPQHSPEQAQKHLAQTAQIKN